MCDTCRNLVGHNSSAVREMRTDSRVCAAGGDDRTALFSRSVLVISFGVALAIGT